MDNAQKNQEGRQGKQLIRDLVDGEAVHSQFVVRDAETKTKKDGGPYIQMKLSDRTGSVAAYIWEGIDQASPIIKESKVVMAQGTFSVHPKYGRRITVGSLQAVPKEEMALDQLLELPEQSAGELERQLREIEASITNPHLKELLERIFRPDGDSWKLFKRAPAAKQNHQAYLHGLLEHCVLVADAVDDAARAFPNIDRDLAVTGALLHDIGKMDAYTSDPLAIDFSDDGRLQGEITLGYYRLRKAIEDLPNFPPELEQKLLHIQLSHHGALEHGSPVRPLTREAVLVHMIDNLGGKLGSFDRLEKRLGEGERWSGWDKVIEGFAFFPDR